MRSSHSVVWVLSPSREATPLSHPRRSSTRRSWPSSSVTVISVSAYIGSHEDYRNSLKETSGASDNMDHPPPLNGTKGPTAGPCELLPPCKSLSKPGPRRSAGSNEDDG